jgi:hypothetical protein
MIGRIFLWLFIIMLGIELGTGDCDGLNWKRRMDLESVRVVHAPVGVGG